MANDKTNDRRGEGRFVRSRKRLFASEQLRPLRDRFRDHLPSSKRAEIGNLSLGELDAKVLHPNVARSSLPCFEQTNCFFAMS